MARAAGKQMLAQGRGGKVILMSSARGLLGHPAGYTAYCASKSAIDGITKALGCEWGALGITVNAIGPTVFRSPLTAWMYEDNENCHRGTQGFHYPCAEGPPRRAVRSRRAAPVSRFQGIRLLHRPHPLRRRRLYGGLTMAKARIAVVGAGLMGHGIAQVFALAGHEVKITDTVVKNSTPWHRALPPICAISGKTRARWSGCSRPSISPTRCTMPTTWSKRCRKISS